MGPMKGKEGLVILLTVMMLTWTAPTALASDISEEYPSCEEATEDAIDVEEYYLRTNDGSIEVWEETNDLPGLQTETCYVGEPKEDNLVNPDDHVATVPDDGTAIVDEATNTITSIAGDAVRIVQETCNDVYDIINALTGSQIRCMITA